MIRHWRYGLAAALFIALAACYPASAQTPQAQSGPVTVEQYTQALAEAMELLAEAAASPDERLAAARRRLANIDQVELPSGLAMPVAPLLAEGEEGLQVEEARLRLALVKSQLTAAPHDQTAARLALLDEVLAGPEFAAQENPWQRFRRWLADQLARWLPDIRPARGSNQTVDLASNGLVWLLGGVGLLLLAGLLSYWLQGLLCSFVAEAKTASGRTSGDARPSTPAQARDQAASFARAGDYRQAVRQLYLVALLTLEEHGLVQRNPSLTNREVLAQVGGGDTLTGHLAPVVNTFDAVWYGIQEPTETAFHAYAAEIDALTDAARQVPRDRRRPPDELTT